MTTKTMMQQAWDNWHGDIDPSDIPGIKRGFQEGWERCAELHAGIDMDKINADLIGYRNQIARLRAAIEALTKERDDLSFRYQTASRLVTSLSDALAKTLKERDALKAELARPESTAVSLMRAENAALKDAARLALDALEATYQLDSKRQLQRCLQKTAIRQNRTQKGSHPMTYEQLQKHLMKFFSDTSRSQHETKDHLLTLADEIWMLIQTIDDTE